MDIISKLDGYKTYIAAAGLFGLAVFQASQGQIPQAAQSVMAAIAAAGLRHAVAKGAAPRCAGNAASEEV